MYTSHLVLALTVSSARYLLKKQARTGKASAAERRKAKLAAERQNVDPDVR